MDKTMKKSHNVHCAMVGLGYFAGSLLITAFAVFFYSPVIKSHADSNASENVDINLTIAPTISISVSSDELNLQSLPSAFVQGSVNVDVVTNSVYGYSLGLEDSDANTNMVYSTAGVNDVLTSNFLNAKTSSEMDDNTWGFSTDGTNYYRINPYGSPVRLTNSNAPTSVDPGYDRTQVRFGAKVGAHLTAGTYVDTVVFTAYVNGPDGNPSNSTQLYGKGLSTASSMQSFDCSSISNGDTETLVDLRDNQEYDIVKIGDTCWMQENLNLRGPITLTHELTNMPVNYEVYTYNEQTEDYDITYEPAVFTIPASSLQNFVDAVEHKYDSDSSYKHYYDNGVNGGLYNYWVVRAGVYSFEGEYSICPAGWRLPWYGAENMLLEELDTSDPYNSAMSLSKGGYIDDGVLTGVGTTAKYWTSEADDRYLYQAYSFDGVNNTARMDKIDGLAVRCMKQTASVER